MELLEIRDLSQIDGRKLMDLYGESNAENADYFYPDAADKAAALARVETDFLAYIRDKFLQNEVNRYMVLAEDGAWVSALRLNDLGSGEYYIEALETHPACRRQGYGAALLDMMLDRLKETGPFRVRDCVSKKNTASLRTHEKCGFRAADTVGHDLLDGSVDERCFTMEYRYPAREERSE